MRAQRRAQPDRRVLRASPLERLGRGPLGGSHPDEQIDPVVVQAMAEIGLDVSAEFPKPLTDAVVRAADVVVTLGCGDACAVYPGKRYQDWPVADPAGEPLEVVRRIRYDIYHHVWELIETLVPAVNLAQLPRPSGGTS